MIFNEVFHTKYSYRGTEIEQDGSLEDIRKTQIFENFKLIFFFMQNQSRGQRMYKMSSLKNI